MEKEPWRNIAVVLFIFTIILIGWIIYLSSNIKSSEENLVYKELLVIDNKLVEIGDIVSNAESNYELASYAYEEQDYDNVVTYCEFARDDYSKYTQKLREIKASIDDKDKLLILYKEMIAKEIYRTENMYEVCEHFESAARYYDIYFNTDVDYDDMSFDMGGKEIDMMNDKIKEHDKTVREYNDLLAEYTIELNNRLK